MKIAAKSSRLLGMLSLLSLAHSARAADYLMTVSGPYDSVVNEGVAFDGTDSTPLGPLFDIPRLTGGTFRATYRFSDTPNPPAGTFAAYSFGPSAGMTYELLDAGGEVVHRGTNPSSSGASVINNGMQASGNVFDSVSLYGFVNTVTGLLTPTPIYSPPGQLDSLSSVIGFSGDVAGGNDFITNLAIPTSTSAYQVFPRARFETEMFFGDGDIENFTDPFQYVDTIVTFRITSVSVTQVPSPGASGVLGLAGVLAAKRRRR